MTNEHALLAEWINRRDEEAFHGIVRRYSGLVYATCRRVLGDNTEAQEAALDAFLALSQLRRVPDSPLGAWLYRTAVHRAIDHYRKMKTRTQYESALARETAPEPAAVGWDDISELVDEAVANLPENLRQAVVGHFFEGKTHAELADMEGITRQAITKRIHQGVEEVRSALSKKGVTVGSAAALMLLLTEHASAAPAVPTALAASLGKITLSGFTATGAAAGASMGLAAKALITAVALILVAGVVYPFLPSIATRNMVLLKSIPVTMAKSEYRKMFPKTPARADRPGAAKSAAAGAIAQNEEPALEGGATITGSLQGMFGGLAGEADIVMEKVTWAPNETPPAQTEKRHGKADSSGIFAVEHLTDGDWSLSAWGDLGSGCRNVHIEGGTLAYPNPVKVEVFPCAPCSGMVVDETGTPVPGAVIYPSGHELAPAGELGHCDGAAGRTQSDKDGRFRFDRMAEGGMKYFVAIPGGVPRYTNYVKTGEGIRIQLPPPGRIRGRVVAEGMTGGPEGLTLRFLTGYYRHLGMLWGREMILNDGRIVQTVTTDRNGAFLAETVPGASYRTELPDESGWVMPQPVKVDVAAGKESSVTIRIEQGKALFGQVVDAQTGESLGAGVQVMTYLANTAPSVETDADGFYRFDSLPKGKRPLQIHGPLVAGGRGASPYNSNGGGKPEWTADIQDGETRLDLRVDRARLHGMVTDASNGPLAGVDILVDTCLLVRSGNDGRFDVRCVCAGDPMRLTAEKDGWRGMQMVELTPGGETEANLKLSYQCTGALSGVVEIKGGESAAGMHFGSSVCLNCEEANGDYRTAQYDGQNVIVGPKGEFSLTGLVPGEYGFSLSQTGGKNRYFMYKEKITLKPGEQREGVRLEFEAPQKYIVSGAVVNEAGQPISECDVHCDSLGATPVQTDRNGRFNLELETFGGNTQLNFSAKGYTAKYQDCPVDKGDQVITLLSLQHLYGRVVDPSGTPVTAYHIALYTAASGGKDEKDASGAFDFPEVPAPPATLIVTAEGYGPLNKRFEGTEYDSPVELVLHPAATVEGTVVDAEGTPLAGYTVWCCEEPLTTDEAGRFSGGKCGAGTEADLVVSKTRESSNLWRGKVTAPATVTCRISGTGTAVVNVILDGVPVTEESTLQNEYTAKAEWRTENGVTVQGPMGADPQNQVIYAGYLPPGPVQFRVHMNALEEYGLAVCEKVVEAQVVANKETMVRVNFETPGAVVPAETPTVDNAPATPGVTEE
jgi:RNA polymerase sigma factor (sigma-70 family)